MFYRQGELTRMLAEIPAFGTSAVKDKAQQLAGLQCVLNYRDLIIALEARFMILVETLTSRRE